MSQAPGDPLQEFNPAGVYWLWLPRDTAWRAGEIETDDADEYFEWIGAMDNLHGRGSWAHASVVNFPAGPGFRPSFAVLLAPPVRPIPVVPHVVPSAVPPRPVGVDLPGPLSVLEPLIDAIIKALLEAFRRLSAGLGKVTELVDGTVGALVRRVEEVTEQIGERIGAVVLQIDDYIGEGFAAVTGAFERIVEALVERVRVLLEKLAEGIETVRGLPEALVVTLGKWADSTFEEALAGIARGGQSGS